MEVMQGRHFIRNDKILPAENFDPHILGEGQALYEVIRIISGKPLFMAEHLERLEQSAQKTNHLLNLSQPFILERVDDLIKACHIENVNIKLVIIYQLNKTELAPDFYAYSIPTHYPSQEDYLNGVDTKSYYAKRSNPNAKVANIALNSAIQQEISKHKVYEILLLDHNGNITEGSRSNIFMVKGERIFTAPLQNVLPGITRSVVLRLCQKLGYSIIERKVAIEELADVDAVFLTGTSPNVLPIRSIDQFSFDSAANPAVKSIMQGYDKLISDYIKKL